MTPAQVAHIMELVEEYAVLREHGSAAQYDAAGRAVEAALRDAPQAEGWVMVPVDVLRAASESLGSFVSDHGWGDADMQAMDNLDAYLAARPSAPTAVEPDERAMFEAWARSVGYTDRDLMRDGWNGSGEYSWITERAMWAAWQARASKGTPL